MNALKRKKYIKNILKKLKLCQFFPLSKIVYTLMSYFLKTKIYFIKFFHSPNMSKEFQNPYFN